MSKLRSITALKALLTAGLWAPTTYGAACCSSNAAAPALISGDDRAQLSLSLGASAVVGDAPSVGTAIFRADGDSERLQSLRLDGAILLSDRWQAGISLPFLRHAYSRPGNNTNATALGDVRATLAYEMLPERAYRPWVPKGFVFAQMVFPNAASVYEAENPGDSAGFGRGFYTAALGALFVKQWPRFDAYFLPEAHYSFARTFRELQTVRPGFGGSFALGVGYSPGGGNLRFGLRVQPAYNQSMQVSAPAVTTQTSYQLAWDTAAEASYLVADNWSLTASYTDQTLLGPAVNVSLSRGFLVGLQHRWER